MGRLRTYEARLARLEARIFSIPDPDEQKEEERVLRLYLNVWDRRGSLEDVPEKDRDPSMWQIVSDYAPVHLRMVWEGTLNGREEALAAGVDFTRLEGVDADDVAAVLASGAPGPPVPTCIPDVGGTFRYPRSTGNRSSGEGTGRTASVTTGARPTR